MSAFEGSEWQRAQEEEKKAPKPREIERRNCIPQEPTRSLLEVQLVGILEAARHVDWSSQRRVLTIEVDVKTGYFKVQDRTTTVEGDERATLPLAVASLYDKLAKKAQAEADQANMTLTRLGANCNTAK